MEITLESATKAGIRKFCADYGGQNVVATWLSYSLSSSFFEPGTTPVGVILYIQIQRGFGQGWSVSAIYPSVEAAELATAELACSQDFQRFVADHVALSTPHTPWDYDGTEACSLAMFHAEVRRMVRLTRRPLRDEPSLEDVEREVVQGIAARFGDSTVHVHFFTNNDGRRTCSLFSLSIGSSLCVV